MKRTVLAVVVLVVAAFLLLEPALAAVIRSDAKTEDVVSVPGAKVGYDGFFHLTFSFRVAPAYLESLKEKDANYRVYATAGVYDKSVGAPTYDEKAHYALLGEPTRVTADRASWDLFSITLFGLDREDYATEYTARLFFVTEENGKTSVVESPFTILDNVITLYDAVRQTYNDRTDMPDRTHPYRAPDGSYTPCEDLSPLEACLASCIDLQLLRGEITDKMASKYYVPLYRYSYFDGVLTVEIPGTDIPEGFVLHFFLNGEERAFEVYEGKIRLGVL